MRSFLIIIVIFSLNQTRYKSFRFLYAGSGNKIRTDLFHICFVLLTSYCHIAAYHLVMSFHNIMQHKLQNTACVLKQSPKISSKWFISSEFIRGMIRMLHVNYTTLQEYTKYLLLRQKLRIPCNGYWNPFN